MHMAEVVRQPDFCGAETIMASDDRTLTCGTDNAPKVLRIAVLAGGTSPEREVSIDSGRCAANSLRLLGHSVTIIDPAEQTLDQLLPESFDVILPLVHGTGGEDGSLQRQLDKLNVPYAGSSAEASALTFDKVRTRDRLESCGLRVPPGRVVRPETTFAECQRFAEQLRFPVVVKPAAQGSSVGVSVVSAAGELRTALELARSLGAVVLMEQYIPGRELTVPLIDSRLLPPVEIRPAGTWYDYHAKYLDSQTQYDVNPANVSAEVCEAAGKACEVCGVAAICRVDLRVDPSGLCWILEINTIPGMTSHSLVPMSAAAVGLSTGQLCELAMRAAIKRFFHRKDRGLFSENASDNMA